MPPDIALPGAGAAAGPGPLRARMQGPGGYYNLGNVIGLTTGIVAVLLAPRAGEAETAFGAVIAHLAGSAAAATLSLALIIFFISGEVYFRAWRASPPRIALVRLGDLLSAAGALTLAVSLALLGDVALAIVSTVLLAGGKLGSAAMPRAEWIVSPPGLPTFDPFRWSVILSRLPAILGLVGAIFLASAPLGVTAQQSILLGCYLLWLRADWLLLRIG